MAIKAENKRAMAENQELLTRVTENIDGQFQVKPFDLFSLL